MARLKSLVEQVIIDTAKKAHNCQANSKHRIERGDVRLGVRNRRSWNYYCRNCAQRIITGDIAKLEKLYELNLTD
ncbi:MAG TPA: hypothetical protein DF296_00880 [Candidatus Margulisbacteria bacterium]|nr:MAG: hypothetical protein A2X43_07180 [Candidatus Margulisbacteria bacterium GWD2_39_127]OGI02938.1 MAG: hypothetical protein A2X42_12655 [Candidatus Margulisbacteria bacterium GWF2_38_17]HAR63367.1 hypothetical protein [Candidatus Margulisiibacteriota bacterium]HCT83736.1 hypothetical protein [Candidatus Margulisiibacteriota bacterium]